MSDEVPIIQVSFSEQEREAIKHFEAGFRKGLEKKCKKCEITLRSILRQLREKRETWEVMQCDGMGYVYRDCADALLPIIREIESVIERG